MLKRHVPGACAAIAALSIAALPPQPFHFAGYLPRKSGQRRNRLTTLAELPCTVIYYESPHRIAGALADMHEVLGDRRAVVARLDFNKAVASAQKAVGSTLKSHDITLDQ